jgi:4-amino-4-deoxy-L-arabinose transferase-like glycosyltransferase
MFPFKVTDRHGILVVVFWVLVQFPFLSSAFRIDEPYFLAVARQIYKHPLDPYGFQINWDGTPEWAFKNSANPPFVPAYLAACHCLLPWNEVSFHLAVLPFSIIALCAFGALAQHMKVDPVTSQVLLCCSPAFFLGSQVVMQDVPMLSLFLLAVTGAMYYEDSGRTIALIVALFAAFCCPLAKYNGLVLVPVLVILVFTGKRKRGILMIASAPLLSLVLWNLFTWFKYDQNHFLAMIAFQKNPAIRTPLWQLTAGTLAATSLGVLPLCLLGFVAGIPTGRKALLASGILTLPLYGTCKIWLGYGNLPSFLLAVGMWLALLLIGFTFVCGWKFYRRQSSTGLALVIWILSGFAFQTGLLFSSVRYVLFLAPPAILLLLSQSSSPPQKRTRGLLLGINLFLVAMLAIGDARIAEAYREFIKRRVAPLLSESRGRLYFSGHWGFQYYCERLGGEAVDEAGPPELCPRDLMVVARTAWPDVLQPSRVNGQEIAPVAVAFNPNWLIRTIDCDGGANFYASKTYGCRYPTFLPFGFSRGPVEIFLVYRVKGR